jgi:hypothetical protein
LKVQSRRLSMKVVWVAIGLALTLTLAGAGLAACGPEEKYCYQQHKTCAQAELDKRNQEDQDRQRREDAGIFDDGAVP